LNIKREKSKEKADNDSNELTVNC